jgi:hypothetical protein
MAERVQDGRSRSGKAGSGKGVAETKVMESFGDVVGSYKNADGKYWHSDVTGSHE